MYSLLISSCLPYPSSLWASTAYENNHAYFGKEHIVFYLDGVDNKKKYQMVKWKFMCRPKGLGGFGLITTTIMNKYLIIKWWWCIYNDPSNSLWLQILIAKYSPAGALLLASPTGGSQFWKSLIKVCDEFRSLIKFTVDSCSSVRF